MDKEVKKNSGVEARGGIRLICYCMKWRESTIGSQACLYSGELDFGLVPLSY